MNGKYHRKTLLVEYSPIKTSYLTPEKKSLREVDGRSSAKTSLPLWNLNINHNHNHNEFYSQFLSNT
jgi:hypothetical protein